MAAFREHIAVSCALGAGYTVVLTQVLHQDWIHATLAGGLCGVAGMLPDLDSDTGRPTQELFGITAAVVPLLLLHRLHDLGVTLETTILLAAGLYLFIRFIVAWVFKRFTVHRGMFHSLPAAAIAAEIAYLAHDCPEEGGRLMIAGGVLLGFLSHLVLDELYSVDLRGLVPRLNKAAGSALKLASKSVPATLAAWLVLGVLTYLAGIEQGYFKPVALSLRFDGTEMQLETPHQK